MVCRGMEIWLVICFRLLMTLLFVCGILKRRLPTQLTWVQSLFSLGMLILILNVGFKYAFILVTLLMLKTLLGTTSMILCFVGDDPNVNGKFSGCHLHGIDCWNKRLKADQNDDVANEPPERSLECKSFFYQFYSTNICIP
jgi:hypothetical protein